MPCIIALAEWLKRMSKKVERRYFFTSTHYGEGKYNEMHPCRIVRKRWIERGWYINSFYKVSRFSGYKFGVVSFGLISGYRKYRIPYIIFHWKNKFYVPAFLLLGTKIKWITCEYTDKTWSSYVKLAYAKLKREGQWKWTYKR